jgi:hypothetical protein
VGVPVTVDVGGSTGIGVAGSPDGSSVGVEDAPVTSGWVDGVVGVVVVVGVGVAGVVVVGPGVTAQVDADVASESGVTAG